jgi:aryl-phospho-beta-D-glucosidase BglC (GH1 family)
MISWIDVLKDSGMKFLRDYYCYLNVEGLYEGHTLGTNAYYIKNVRRIKAGKNGSIGKMIAYPY